MSQLHHPDGPSLESLSPALPLPLRLERERDECERSDDLSLPRLLDSGGSMNDTRFGVDRPELLMPMASDTLSQLLLSESAGDVGVGGADLPRVPFSAEWRGGLGARVEDECRGLVNSRDTLAVVVDASATGTTGGGLRNAGFASSFSFCFSGERGLFSRMLRRYDTVRSTCRSSEDEELEAEGSSMMGGVSHIRRTDDGERFVESWLCDREVGPRRGEAPCRGFRVTVETLALLDPLRFPSEEEGELFNDVELDRDREALIGGLTTDDRMSTARFGRSLSEPTAWRRKGRLLEKESSGRGVGTGREERRPRVGGNVIEDGSSVESMYIVIALGGGATRSLRS